jgi:hypothetical protein
MSVAYNPKIVTDGLVLCLDAANRKSYPGSGNTWFDLSGNGNNGTLVNEPTFSNGVMNLDGINDYVTGTVIASNTWTMSLWYKSNTITGALVYYPFSTSSTTGIGFGGTFDSNTINRWYFFDSSTNFSVASIVVSQWYNMIVAKTGTTYNFYTNGKLSLANQTGLNLSVATYNVGRRVDGIWYANGSIGIASIYNRTLSSQEIQQNFNATRGRYGI